MNLDTAIDRAVEAVGLTVLKPLQRDIIRSFCSGNDVFVSLPTGYGKSYCFVLVFNHLLGSDGSIVICISPLTSLMMEQREKYSAQGICSEFVGVLQQDIDAMTNEPRVFAVKSTMERDASTSCVPGESSWTCM